MSDKRWTASQGSAPGADPFGELCRKVLLLVAEDRLALSNYRPLIGFLKEIALSVVVATRSSGRLAEIEELGVRVIDFDHRPPSLNPVREVSSAWAIGRVLEAEDPDVVHLVGLEPVILGGLAPSSCRSRYVVVQMPGLAAHEAADGNLPRLYHAGALRLMASMLRRPSSCLLVENADDLALLRARGIDPGGRFAMLGGAGIDPQAFPALPAPNNATPVAAFVGQHGGAQRHRHPDAGRRAPGRARSPLRFELCGAVDHESREEIAADVLADWCAAHGARWPGHVADVREVWSRVDICVLPARTGGGVPRALLEAAACARPLVVTDVPGCRHFVRDGIEGLVVRREDPDALAAALDLLARDPEMRQRMGEAARLRLLHGFTRDACAAVAAGRLRLHARQAQRLRRQAPRRQAGWVASRKRAIAGQAQLAISSARAWIVMPSTGMRRRRPRSASCGSRTPTATSISCGCRSMCMRATSSPLTSTDSAMRWRRNSLSHAAGASAMSRAPACASAPLVAFSAAATSASTLSQACSLASSSLSRPAAGVRRRPPPAGGTGKGDRRRGRRRGPSPARRRRR